MRIPLAPAPHLCNLAQGVDALNVQLQALVLRRWPLVMTERRSGSVSHRASPQIHGKGVDIIASGWLYNFGVRTRCQARFVHLPDKILREVPLTARRITW